MSQIQSTILEALREEKKWYRRRLVISFAAFICAVAVFFGLAWYWKEAGRSFHVMILFWCSALGAGVFLALKPQPRIELEGYWSSYVLAKLLVVAVLIGFLQLLLCPHFAHLDHDMGGLGFFGAVSDFYVKLGGMKACFFFCGLSFGAIAGLASQWWLRKTSSLTRWRPYLLSSLIVFALLVPINLLQFHSEHQMLPIYWPFGLFLGVFGGGLLVLLLARRPIRAVGVPSSLEDFQSLYLTSAVAGGQRPSIFFEQAETHSYSDWLLPTSFETGWDYGNDFYFAGFPDLSEVLKRDKTSYAWNEDVWKTYRREGMTPLGRKLQEQGRGKLFVDLASGLKNVSCVPRRIAEEIGASFYVGVDQIYSQSELVKEGFRQEYSCLYWAGDVFQFVKSMRPSADWVVFLAGLEVKERASGEALLEAQSLMRQLRVAMKKGAVLLLGAASHDFVPPADDFKIIGQDRYHRLYLRR